MNGLLYVQGSNLFFLRLQDQLCVEFFTQARSYFGASNSITDVITSITSNEVIN